MRINTGPALASGIKELDNLMGGPIPWGFGVMIVGPPGIGKSSLAAQFAVSAAEHRKKVCMYFFEESPTTFLGRCARLGIGIAKERRKRRQLNYNGSIPRRSLPDNSLTTSAHLSTKTILGW